MARLPQIKAEDWPDELREVLKPDQRTELEQGLMRYWAHRPDLVQGMMAFSGGLKIHRTLPEKLVELVRLRIAFFNQCRSCMAIRYTDALDDGLDEALVCSLAQPAKADNLTDAEKVAIRYGELMAADHLSIDDELYAELQRHFSTEQIVELGMVVAFFVGFGRLAATYHMVEELPEVFQQDTDTRLTPWNNESIVVR